jgi:hypothetical protein
VNGFADYLNLLLTKMSDFELFKKELIADTQIPASDELIRSAQQAMQVFKLRHFATILF